MVKRFLREKKKIVKLFIAAIPFCMPFVFAEIFWFKGAFIPITVTFALGILISIVNGLYRKSQIEYLNATNETAMEVYSVSDKDGTFEIITDNFGIQNQSKRCRIVNALEILPIFFIAIFTIIAATLKRPLGKTWALCIVAFFLILNINIYLSYLYKNSVNCAQKGIGEPKIKFSDHILLSKKAVCFYAVAEAVIFVIGLLNVFFDVFNAYGWLFIIAATVILLGVFALLNKGAKKSD